MKPSRLNAVNARHRPAGVSVARHERGQLQAQLQDLREELATAQAELELNALRDAQAEIEESRHHYADLYDFAPVGYLTLDRNGCIRTVNVTGARLLGQDRGHLLGRPLLSVIAQPDCRKFLTHLGQLRKGRQQVSTEMRIAFKQQPPVPVQLISVRDGRHRIPTHFRSAIVDLTERKRAEEELRQSREALEQSHRELERRLSELTAYSDAMTRLQKIGSLFVGGGNLEAVLGEILDTAIAIAGADFGSIQLLDENTSDLKIVAQRGFPKWWLDFWNRVSKGQGACGTALERGERVIVEDVESSPIFAGSPALNIQLRAGVKAVQSTPIVNRSGKPLGMFSTHHKKPHRPDDRVLRLLDLLMRQTGDIIERARAEEALHRAHAELEERVRERTAELTRINVALHESQGRLQAIMDNSPAMIFVKDTEGRYLHVNRKFADVFHSPLEKTVGRTDADIFPVKQAITFRANDLKVIREGVPLFFEEVAIHDDGPHHSLVTKFPLRDGEGKIFAVGSIVTDITERQRAEEALVRSERNLTNFFDSAPVGLEWLSPSGVVLRVNQAQLDLLGHTPDEYLEREISEFFVNQAAATELLERLAARETVSNFRTQLRRKDGSIRHVLIDANSVWDGKRLVHNSIFTRDISERVRLEREVLNVSEQERRRIAHDLHDGLGQLLSATVYMASTLHDDLAAKSLPEAKQLMRVQKLLDEAITQARRLARGLDPVAIEPGGLMAALEDLALRTKSLFRIECQFLCPRPVPIDDGTVATHLYRIAQEAVTNAVKHGSSKHIEIGMMETAQRIVLAVKDDGVGLSVKRPKKAGMGLRIMQYRAGLVGATLAIQKLPRRGTAVVCSIHKPVPQTTPTHEKHEK